MIEFMFNVKMTTDHDEIRRWVEKHNGKPFILDSPDAGAEKIGLRIDFPGKEDEKFLSENKIGHEIDWDKFFKIFEDQKLAFIYQENGHEKDPSLMYEFIKRDNLKEEIKLP